MLGARPAAAGITLVTDEATKRELLSELFARLCREEAEGDPTRNAIPRLVTPLAALRAVRIVDPAAQRRRLAEVKADIAAELLAPEEALATLSLFEAEVLFDRQAAAPVIDLGGFAVLFDGRPMLSNACEALDTALRAERELAEAIAALKDDEVGVRGRIASEEAAQAAHMQSDLRRTVRTAVLRAELAGREERLRRHASTLAMTERPLLVQPTGDGDASDGHGGGGRLAALRAERRHLRDAQESVIERETAVELACSRASQATERVAEQLQTLRAWQATALRSVATEAADAAQGLRHRHAAWAEATDRAMDRLEERIVAAGRSLVLGAITAVGRRAHLDALGAVGPRANLEVPPPRELGRFAGLPLFRRDSLALSSWDTEGEENEGGEESAGGAGAGRGDFFWLQVPREAVASRADFASDADFAAAAALSDVANLAPPPPPPSRSEGGCPLHASSSAIGDAGAELQRRARELRVALARVSPQQQHSSRRGQSDVAAAREPMACAEFEALCSLCQLPIPGSVRITFAELADQALPENSHVLRAGGGGDRREEEEPWALRVMSEERFVEVLQIVGALAFPQLAPLVSGPWLALRLLDEVVMPRLHGATVRSAIGGPASARRPPEHPETNATPAAPAAVRDDHPALPVTDDAAAAGSETIVSVLFDAHEALAPRLPQLARAFTRHAVRYTGAQPVAIRGRRGISAARLLAALRLAEQPPSAAHGAIFRARSDDALSRVYAQPGAIDFFAALVHHSKDPKSSELEMEASIDAAASYISLAVPQLFQHVVAQQLVAAITEIAASSLVVAVAPAAGAPGKGFASGAVGQTHCLDDPQVAMEVLFGVLPGDPESRVEAAGVPLLLFLCAVVLLSRRGHGVPALEAFLDHLCDPSAGGDHHQADPIHYIS